jgi:hypothetical protein
MNSDSSVEYDGPTELFLYMVPGNISKLIRIPLGMKLPHEDLITPPEPMRLDADPPVDRTAPVWRCRLTEAVFEYGDEVRLDLRRIRVLYPKAQIVPSKQWVQRAVSNLINSVH